MFLTGITVFLAALALLAKLKRRWLLRLLAHDLAIDLAVSATVLAIHWGTFSGVMAATFAGLLMSICTSAAKRAVGYIHAGRYYPGIFALEV